MKKPTLLFDLDCTVWEFFEPLLYRYNETFDTNITISEITEYDFSEKLNIPVDMFFKKFLTKEYFETFEPYPRAVETINQLYFCNKYNIRFLSAGAPRTAYWRLEKLDNLFGWFTSRHLILCQDKQLVQGDVLFDDCLDNFKKSEIFDIFPKYLPIIPAQPWNKNLEKLKGNSLFNPIRFFSWDFNMLEEAIDEHMERKEELLMLCR